MCVAIVASFTREVAVQSFAYHAHRTNPAVIQGHDKRLNQQCMLAQARPPMIMILLVLLMLIDNHCTSFDREIVAKLLHSLRVTKLKFYKHAFISSVISSKLFKHSGRNHSLEPRFSALCFVTQKNESLDFLHVIKWH